MHTVLATRPKPRPTPRPPSSGDDDWSSDSSD